MDEFEKLIIRSKKLENESKLIREDVKMIIDENDRVKEVAENVSFYLKDIDRRFAEATKLDIKDYSFLFFAVSLQCLRQYLLTPFEERSTHDVSEKEYKKREKEIFDDKFGQIDNEGNNILYTASLSDIISNGVPYDVQFGSPDFDLGLSGNAHRYRTLGHDPLLGWIFGTSNIMTSTLTSWDLNTYHITPSTMTNGYLKAKITEQADTAIMFEKVKNRAINEPEVLAAALIKQGLHIKSDEYSKAGLPIPGTILISPDFSQELAQYGMDAGNLKTVAKQATYSILINMLIAMLHRIFYNEETCGSLDLYKVKTRKILMYSNIIASASNLVVVAIESVMKRKPTMKNLDIGGLLVTLYRIVADTKFITNVKAEFIYNNFNQLIKGDEYNFNIK
ncbi:hypothetical protein COD90_05070 [Bacillus cereus]|uniref:hypothetical protein n=1 Tax=Bacillus sp. OE TaxID=2293320 RepID=UPI000BFCA064|nr:hypothetical protein COD90_05070 [Bacillus cereus]RFB13300.1 hypothetical protein DZB88_15420 [Bacillus sp. OE]HDR6300661.1 hypothetical protein [Bacillus cereus]